MDIILITVIVLFAAQFLGIVACVWGGARSKSKQTKGTLWGITWLLIALPVLLGVLLINLGSRHPTEETFMLLGAAALIETLFLTVIFGWIRKKAVWISVLCVILCFGAGCGWLRYRWNYESGLAKFVEPDDLLWTYNPANGSNMLAVTDAAPTLSLTDNLPVLDGATALYPVYAAFANAVYPMEALDPGMEGEDIWAQLSAGSSEVLLCNTTTEAYKMLVDGEADIIFVAGPSDEQLQYAAEKGEEMVFTPIGRECFVFFVNAQNPVNGLTVEQIRGIYSGQIKNWKELGADIGKIRPFQRDEGSGSQSALVRFMGDAPLMEAPTENVVDGMGGIIERTADYRNFPNAIGYSFRFYSTEMVQNGEIKLLEINGVAPTKENILNDSYPITDSFYAVTLASNDNPNVPVLIDWILSEQGQELIDKTGYVALK